MQKLHLMEILPLKDIRNHPYQSYKRQHHHLDKLSKTNQGSIPSTSGQIKCLVDMAKNVIKGWGQEETPAVLLLAMISIISQQVNAAEAQNLLHWAFVPHPPLLHAVTWKSPFISVFANDSELVGCHSSGHLVPTFTNYNFIEQAVVLAICLGNLPSLPLMPIWKSALLWNGTQFLDKKNLQFLVLMPANLIMLHISLTFPTVMTNTIPGTPIREPHGNNVHLFLQWLFLLQATSLCIDLIMTLLKLIL
jgi:hypothetical protein